MLDLLNTGLRFTEKCDKLIGCQLHVPLSLNPGLVNYTEKTQRFSSACLSAI